MSSLMVWPRPNEVIKGGTKCHFMKMSKELLERACNL